MAFGKPGRPPEDRLARQAEIYLAVAPLILEGGARHLSMRAAADAACMSIGGLYHYFPTKRDLVLHGLDEAARTRLCHEYRAAIADVAAWGLSRWVESYLDFAQRMIDFMRPAVQAALDLGVDEFQTQLDSGLVYHVTDLVETLRVLVPAIPGRDLESLARAMRRLVLGTLIDRTDTRAELRDQQRALIYGYAVLTQRAAATA
ncbi:MAG: TetR/AcrR family transcriptional regulator [Thermomicrobiales bacterium]